MVRVQGDFSENLKNHVKIWFETREVQHKLRHLFGASYLSTTGDKVIDVR